MACIVMARAVACTSGVLLRARGQAEVNLHVQLLPHFRQCENVVRFLYS